MHSSCLKCCCFCFLTSHYLEELPIAAKHTGDIIACSLQGSVQVNLTDGLSITVTWSSQSTDCKAVICMLKELTLHTVNLLHVPAHTCA